MLYGNSISACKSTIHLQMGVYLLMSHLWHGLLVLLVLHNVDAFGSTGELQPKMIPEYSAVVEGGMINLTCLYVFVPGRPTTISIQQNLAQMLLIVSPNASVISENSMLNNRNYKVLVHRIDRQHSFMRRFTAGISVLLYNATEVDKGDYWCIVYSFRSVSSALVSVVAKLPQMSLSASPRIITEGNPVTAQCAASVDSKWKMGSDYVLELVVRASFKDVNTVLLIPLANRTEATADNRILYTNIYSYWPQRVAGRGEFITITCQIVDFTGCFVRFRSAACVNTVALTTQNIFIKPSVATTFQSPASLSVHVSGQDIILSCFSPFGEIIGIDYYAYMLNAFSSSISKHSQQMAWLFTQEREATTQLVRPPSKDFDHRYYVPVNVTRWRSERGLRVSRVFVRVTNSTVNQIAFQCRIRNEFGEFDSSVNSLSSTSQIGSSVLSSAELPVGISVTKLYNNATVIACSDFVGSLRFATLERQSLTFGFNDVVALAFPVASVGNRTYLQVISSNKTHNQISATLMVSEPDYQYSSAASDLNVTVTNTVFFTVPNQNSTTQPYVCRVQTDLATYSNQVSLPSVFGKQELRLFAAPTELDTDATFVCLFPGNITNEVLSVSLVTLKQSAKATAFVSASFSDGGGYTENLTEVNSTRLQSTAYSEFAVFTLAKVTPSDEMYYACLVRLRNSSVIRSAFVPTLFYQSAVARPIVEGNGSLVADQAYNVSCQSMVKGYPVSFTGLGYANGSSDALNYTLPVDSGQATSVFIPQSSSNNGSLACETYSPAAVGVRVAVREMKLEVQYPVRNVDVKVELDYLLGTVLVNGYEVLTVRPQANVKCVADGNPAAEASWINEGDTSAPNAVIYGDVLNVSIPSSAVFTQEFQLYRCVGFNSIGGIKRNFSRIYGIQVEINREKTVLVIVEGKGVAAYAVACVLAACLLILFSVAVLFRKRIINWCKKTHSIPFVSRSSASVPVRIRYSLRSRMTSSVATDRFIPYATMIDEEDGVIEFSPGNLPDEAPPAYDALPPASTPASVELVVNSRRSATFRRPPPSYYAAFIPGSASNAPAPYTSPPPLETPETSSPTDETDTTVNEET